MEREEMDLREFDDIRPYYDDEIHEKLSSLLEEEQFHAALKFILNETEYRQMLQTINTVNSVDAFQKEIIYPILQKIIRSSIDELTYFNLEQLSPEKNYLFISNHRDIVMDSALINNGLVANGMSTHEIAIGNNLISLDWVRRLVRLNKNFIVRRDVERHDLYKASLKLSKYIYYALTQKKQSVWIAQREGRAKDGNDFTQPSLIKMLLLNAGEDVKQYVEQLNIIPVSISYQYDPADLLKLNELAAKANGETYVKQPGEDEQHMITGIIGYKGDVNITFGTPLNNRLSEVNFNDKLNKIVQQITDILDEEIILNYHLTDVNHAAFDILNNKTTVDQLPDTLQEFKNRYQKLKDAPKEYMQLWLEMYANPVKNKLKLKQADKNH
jgi:hypothetical protein